MLFVYIIFRLIYYCTHVTFVVQTIKFTAILLVRSFSATTRLKRMPLPFQMNIDKDLSENGMNLDDDVLYNFTDASSQLMKDDDVTPWRGPREKHSLFLQCLIDAFTKPEGIVADLTADTGIIILFLL
jgi:hypothetical protein